MPRAAVSAAGKAPAKRLNRAGKKYVARPGAKVCSGAGFNAQSRISFSKTPHKAIDHQVDEDNKAAQDKLHARRQAGGIDDRWQIMLDEAVCIMIRVARPT